MDELKESLRSIVISSRKRPSIEELRKDYYTIEGRQLPFKRFGFNSAIELIQNMSDIFSVPSNPKEYSIVSLVGETKSDHLIQLIANQKTNTKRGRPRRSENEYSFHNKSSHNSNHYNRSKSTGRSPINLNSQPLQRSKSFYFENTNRSYSNQNDTEKAKSSLVSHVSDAPHISLKPSGINNSKQSVDGNHSINNNFTSVLNKNDDETTNMNIRHDPTIVTDFVNKCKAQTMMRSLEDSNFNRNSMVQLKNKIDFVKRHAKVRQDRNDKLKNSSGIEKSQDSSANANGMCKSELVSVANSTPKQNHSDNIENLKFSNMIQLPSIPEDILWKIATVFRAYHNSMNYILFLFLYKKIHYSKFEPKDYGFNSPIEFFKHFDQHFKVRNNVVYINADIPNYNELTKTENWSNTHAYINSQNKIISIVLYEHISLHLDQTLVYDDSKIAMVLSDIYFPSLFYMRLCSKMEDFNILMEQMESFYDEANIKYCVRPEHVLVGSCYVTSYTEFVNKWRRVKILCEVNSTHVQVIQVDYGTVNYILKTSLRFLKKEFCNLNKQAIQCCLSGYNDIDEFDENVTEAFLHMVNNRKIMVEIDRNTILNNQNQVLHVTLFDQMKNINYDLVKCHMYLKDVKDLH